MRAGRPHVLIVGAGVAGLETLLALRALAGARVDVTLLAPELKFVNRSTAVEHPFKTRRSRGIRLQSIADHLDARWHRGVVDRVERAHRRVVTKDGDRLAYDMLVLTPGARAECGPDSRAMVTFRDGRDGPRYRLLLEQLTQGRVGKLAFVRPSGGSWLMPLYDLALLTAAYCAERDLDVQLRLITPEDGPLSMFGDAVSAAVEQQLAARGVVVQAGCYGASRGNGWLQLWPGARRVHVDRIVTLPRLVGPRLRGVPCDRDGFLLTDSHGRVVGLDGVFAAGDATTFPIKQGGLAAQQADAVAQMIAASVGADVRPEPFRPVLRGMLLTGGPARFMRADISGRAGTDSITRTTPLWWPPNKLFGRYLAPFLSAWVGDAAT